MISGLRAHVVHVRDGGAWTPAVRSALEKLSAAIISDGTRVLIKPNLTWRQPMPGVTTTPGFLAALIEAVRERGAHVTVCESDGGYHAFKAEEAFESHGLWELKRRFGIEVVNLSHEAVELRTVEIAGRRVNVELPRILLEEVDVFVTLPVPKVHVMTGVSLGFKNQWGCQPATMRLRNHPDFAHKILAINKLLKPRLTIYDGTFFLDRTGPMVGEPVRMDLLIASNDVGAGDLVCCEIMGIDSAKVRHLRLAQREGMMPYSLEEVTLNQALAPLRTRQFRLQRNLINWIQLAAFHSHLGTHVFYDSPLAEPLHKIFYTIRRNPFIGRLLYGPIGPPSAEGRRR